MLGKRFIDASVSFPEVLQSLSFFFYLMKGSYECISECASEYGEKENIKDRVTIRVLMGFGERGETQMGTKGKTYEPFLCKK